MNNKYKDWKIGFIRDQKNIVTEYPFLRARTAKGDIDIEAEFPMMSLEIPSGWNRLFYQMCDDIKPLLEKEGIIDKFYFVQVKEKYGELRCYTNGVESSNVRIILQKYEYLSRFVCVKCGEPADFVSFGYIASFCNDCLNKHMDPKSYTNLQFIDTYEVVGFDIETKERHTKTISVKEEWERYLRRNKI